MPSELVSIHLDEDDHGGGNLNSQTQHSFIQNTKIARIFDDAFPDDSCDDDDGNSHCDPYPIEGSLLNVFVEGKLIHRNKDHRTCGGITITSQISNVYSG